MKEVSDWLSNEIATSLRSLLGGKHLYQGVVIDRGTLQSNATKKFAKLNPDLLQRAIDEALNANWSPYDEIAAQRPSYGESGEAALPPRISFLVDAIKTACAECREITPFNLKDVFDTYHQGDRRWRPIEALQGQQEFVFMFECQSCRRDPDVFLVRRRGLRLTLCGRSPMELVLVPQFIPKTVQRYYSSAVVAFQSGQILAALFLLRVVIEQFTRQEVRATQGRADEVLDQYVNLLPEDFKKRFPSLKEVYGALSAAIHAANESAELFEGSRKKIERHFDARRVFRI